MTSKLLFPIFLVISACASVQDLVRVNVNQANGTPVSAELASRYPTIESFIHASLDNKTPAGQPKRPMSEPVVWHAIVSGGSSLSRYAKKPRLDLEVYCSAHGGSFTTTPSNARIRELPPESPFITGLRAQAFAYSKGASEAVARDAFAYAYEEQAARAGGGLTSLQMDANRIISEGYVGVFECRGANPENSWLAMVDIVGARTDGGFKYILMRIQSRK